MVASVYFVLSGSLRGILSVGQLLRPAAVSFGACVEKEKVFGWGGGDGTRGIGIAPSKWEERADVGGEDGGGESSGSEGE
jgi:hypothetical protein